MKKRTYTNGVVDEHPVLFPSILRQGPSTQFRTPIDDEHTWHVHINFWLTDDGQSDETTWDPPVEYIEPYKVPADKSHPNAWYDRRSVLSQDHMAWETQGPVTDRSAEHLSYSDRGVVLLRPHDVRADGGGRPGEDQLGVIATRHPIVDTNIDETLQKQPTHRGGCPGVAGSSETGGGRQAHSETNERWLGSPGIRRRVAAPLLAAAQALRPTPVGAGHEGAPTR